MFPMTLSLLQKSIHPALVSRNINLCLFASLFSESFLIRDCSGHLKMWLFKNLKNTHLLGSIINTAENESS